MIRNLHQIWLIEIFVIVCWPEPSTMGRRQERLPEEGACEMEAGTSRERLSGWRVRDYRDDACETIGVTRARLSGRRARDYRDDACETIGMTRARLSGWRVRDYRDDACETIGMMRARLSGWRERDYRDDASETIGMTRARLPGWRERDYRDDASETIGMTRARLSGWACERGACQYDEATWRSEVLECSSVGQPLVELERTGLHWDRCVAVSGCLSVRKYNRTVPVDSDSSAYRSIKSDYLNDIITVLR